MTGSSGHFLVITALVFISGGLFGAVICDLWHTRTRRRRL